MAFYNDLVRGELLQEMLGKSCVDDPFSTPIGVAGTDASIYVLKKTRKDNLWPVHERISSYTEEDMFDVIEFLFDEVSLGVDGWLHEWDGCGMHYANFEHPRAQQEYRDSVNELLHEYGSGYELTADGEIVHLPESGFENLMTGQLPGADTINVVSKVQAAIAKYLRRSSTLDDRRDAVRGLADVLEFLRPKVKGVLLTKDESDLFNIANNFAIRHHNDRQRTDYDPNIWTSWMFYTYLATIHAIHHLLVRGDAQKTA